jgi:hypothetical protein
MKKIVVNLLFFIVTYTVYGQTTTVEHPDGTKDVITVNKDRTTTTDHLDKNGNSIGSVHDAGNTHDQSVEDAKNIDIKDGKEDSGGKDEGDKAGKEDKGGRDEGDKADKGGKGKEDPDRDHSHEDHDHGEHPENT